MTLEKENKGPANESQKSSFQETVQKWTNLLKNEEFFGKAALLLGRESIIELKKGRKDLKIGEPKFEETQTPEGNIMFTFIQE